MAVVEACCGAVMDHVINPVGHAVGRVANPIVECIDVDGVVRKIDVNAVLDRVDINALLDRVDFDRHLNKIDFNRVLARVDVNSVIARSDLGAIIAQSTTGVFGSVFDTLRTQLVLVDLVCFRIARFRWRIGGPTRLPPKPIAPSEGGDEVREPPFYPRGRMAKAVAVQGRYTGFFSKAVAIFIDIGLVTLMFAVLMATIQLGLMLFQGSTKEDAKQSVDRSNFWVIPFYCIIWWLWFFVGVSLVGQTVGMSIAGIKVVHAKKNFELSACQAAIRTALLPISLTLMPFLGAVGFFRRDGRMFHDIVAGTGIVYRWDAKMAEIREKAEIQLDASDEFQPNSPSETTSLLSNDEAHPT